MGNTEGTAGTPLLTGWSAQHGAEIVVIEHAVDGALVDLHQAVCGTALPVVDRRRPWTAVNDACCGHCLETLTRSAA